MGVPGLPQNIPPQAISGQQAAAAAYKPVVQSGVSGVKVFDQFEQRRLKPAVIEETPGERLKMLLFHPFSTRRLSRFLAIGTQDSKETLFQRLKMFHAVSKSLTLEGRRHLHTLLKSGALTNLSTETGHSTLYYLYALITTPRARGFDPDTTLNDLVRILNKPYTITQKFGTLSEKAAKDILATRNNNHSLLNRANEFAPSQPISWNDLNVNNSATCVASSVMYYMADKNPAELSRQLVELTSPMRAFFEASTFHEISPHDPGQAETVLKENQIKYTLTGPDTVQIKVDLPTAGYIRAISANKARNTRTGIETAYQSALTFLVTRRTYDPATDFRDANNPSIQSKGLTEPEKTLMESIIKDNGGVISVTYQVVAGKANPKPEEEGQSYLYGYTRTFEQTTSDLINALKMGEFVIIGITETDASGQIIGGHEITVTSAFVDKKDGEVKFVVVDSDDNIPEPVIRSARELIPRIHHAGMPYKLADQINTEIEQIPGYFTPTDEDRTHFAPLQQSKDPLPADAFTPAATHETESNRQAETANYPLPLPIGQTYPRQAVYWTQAYYPPVFYPSYSQVYPQAYPQGYYPLRQAAA